MDKKVNIEKTNLALNINPKFCKSIARFGISGSFNKTNQELDKKKEIDIPKNIKIIKSHKNENFLLSTFNLFKLLLIKIAAAGVAGSQ